MSQTDPYANHKGNGRLYKKKNIFKKSNLRKLIVLLEEHSFSASFFNAK